MSDLHCIYIFFRFSFIPGMMNFRGKCYGPIKIVYPGPKENLYWIDTGHKNICKSEV